MQHGLWKFKFPPISACHISVVKSISVISDHRINHCNVVIWVSDKPNRLAQTFLISFGHKTSKQADCEESISGVVKVAPKTNKKKDTVNQKFFYQNLVFSISGRKVVFTAQKPAADIINLIIKEVSQTAPEYTDVYLSCKRSFSSFITVFLYCL